MIFAKYEFPDKQIWDNHKKQITDSEGNPIECAIVEIGQICNQTDEEGNCIQLSNGYAVDIMWFGEIHESFNQYEVFPNPVGVHTFSGCDELYKERFCEFNPNSEYCNAQ